MKLEPTEEERRSISKAIALMLKRKREHEAKQEWAFNNCPHDQVLRFEYNGVAQEHCRNCGAERTALVIP
jgi:hypothetical protein